MKNIQQLIIVLSYHVKVCHISIASTACYRCFNIMHDFLIKSGVLAFLNIW